MLTKLQTAGAALMLTAALTTGIAYAAPQAGDSLQAWYQTSYNKAVRASLQKLVKQGGAKLDQTAQAVTAAQQKAGRAELREYQSQWLDQFEGRLNKHKEIYFGQIGGAQAELLGENGAISGRFAGYTERVSGQINEQLELEARDVLDRLLEQPDTTRPSLGFP